MAGLWCASLGFSEPRLAQAASRQYNRIGFDHTFDRRTSAVTSELAEKLVAMTGLPGARAYFATSGSEANETMVKLAWRYHLLRGKPEKRKIIARDGAFHGSSIVAASLCGLPMMHRHFGLPLPGILHTLCPDGYRVREEGESDAVFVARLAGALEEMILAEGPDTISAFIAEPVMAAGGVIVPPPGYFEAIQAVLSRYDILCLADEIVCGFGRTGHWFGHQAMGMRPDMMSMAKGLTAAHFPMSAVVLSAQIHDVLADDGRFGHGFTYSGHPVGAAVALEAIAIYEERDIAAHAGRMGARLRNGLAAAAVDSPIVGEVRGIGLMCGVEFMADPQARLPFDPADQVGVRFQTSARERGLIVRAMKDVIGFSPPLIVDEPVVDAIVTLFTQTLREIEAQLGLAAPATERASA
jgi:4-aminobutyrate--pyruvate transaminase